MNRSISANLLDEILSKVDIVEVASEYLTLKKTGAGYKALCPFHQEKTPSFHVHPGKQIFHCFGCGVGGNVFGLVMRMEQVSFPEAVALVGRRAGVEVQAAAVAESPEKKEILEANRFAAQVYGKELFSPQGRRALDYLGGRAMEEEAARRYGLGYAPYEPEFLKNAVRKQGLSESSFVRAGLLHAETGTDYFRNRVLFPIFDIRGCVIGFGARALEENQTPKYLNSMENPAFSKSRVLYGINWAREDIRAKEYAIIVEGYFDVLRLSLHGIGNVVAPLGTALTDGHLRLLRRFTERLVLVFDSDEAGLRAAMRNLENVVRHGFDVRVTGLPAGFDPDSFVREYGVEPFQKFLRESPGFLDFVLAVGGQVHDVRTPRGRASLAHETCSLVSCVPDEIERDGYVRELARKLDVEEAVVRAEVERKHARSGTGEPEPPGQQEKRREPPGTEAAENYLMEILLDDGSYWDRILGRKEILPPRISRVIEEAQRLREQNLEIRPSALIGSIPDQDICAWVSNLALGTGREWNTETRERTFEDCLARLRRCSLSDRLGRTLKKVEEKRRDGMDVDGDMEEIQQILLSLKKGNG